MNEFEQGFESSHLESEKVMGELFRHCGCQWPAIEIEPLTKTEALMRGGRFVDANTILHLRCEVVKNSGIKIDDEICVRGADLRVIETEIPGDGSVIIYAGPAGVNIG